jgi:muramidase (phage lysozyme)
MMSDNLRPFLDMIAWAEIGPAMLAESDNGYNVLVGSLPGRMKLFHDYSDHPRTMIEVRPGLKSTAAGRYQILRSTFDYYRKLLHLPDFYPASQDTIALRIIRERGAHLPLLVGELGLAIQRVSRIWASLPGAGYGQPEKRYEQLAIAYQHAGGYLA